MAEKNYKNYKFKIEEATDNQALEAYQTIKIYNKKRTPQGVRIHRLWWH